MTYNKIANLAIGNKVDQVWLVDSVAVRKTKAGKPFTIMAFKDASGVLDVKLWDFNAEDYPELKGGIFVTLEVQIEEYQGQKNAVSRRTPMVVATPTDLTPYESEMGLSLKEQQEAYEQLMSFSREHIKSSMLKEYIAEVFHADGFAERFMQAPASATNRGAFRGGLVEHIRRVMINAMNLCDCLELSKTKTTINRELVVVGVLMHDVGKVESYTVDSTGAGTSRLGHMIQHLPHSYSISERAFDKVEMVVGRKFDPEIRDHVNHIILAHHGVLEYGSPVKPMSIEAQLVHQADMADSVLTNWMEAVVKGTPSRDEEGIAPGNFFTNKRLYVDSED
jgi:3'-5' exoribonuclease